MNRTVIVFLIILFSLVWLFWQEADEVIIKDCYFVFDPNADSNDYAIKMEDNGVYNGVYIKDCSFR